MAAIDGQNGEFTWSWDNTLSYGLLWRISNQDEAIVGLAAGGTAYSVNGDDGNQNYGKGIASNAAKWNSELQLGYKNFGAFARAFAFYDYENEEKERDRTPLSGDALDRVGSRAEIRDAFVWYKFHLGKSPGEVRVGQPGDQLGREHLHPGRHQRHQSDRRLGPARSGRRAARCAAAGRGGVSSA